MDFSLDIADGSMELASKIGELASAAHQRDGVRPLSEQSLLNLTTTDPDLTHVTVSPRDDRDRVIGYAQVDRRGSVASSEILVAPDTRRRGVGTLLWRTALRDASLPSRSGEPGAHNPLRVWAHGNLPAAQEFARSAGLEIVRELHELSRSLNDGRLAPSLTEAMAAFGPGHAVRAFDPARDEEPWLDLNRRAFASHPEQGQLTLDDLRAREREPWFDPNGFFVVRAGDGDGALVGAAWTKVEPANDPDSRPVSGELYVIAVSPEAQGRGLGRGLTALGLAYLRERGLTTATLWTDGDNAAAMATYRSQGFEIAFTDVQYARPSTAPMAA
ncbi:mycothiol synthase [Rarobacter faecitabidus]|uniref:Mycothiol acetyltransferase n=1 Tax=Rarobacter faecitabidus TaxID=13243 RepID=A0A542ZDW0_RARFA|nr:mycothiol synthase [Rarobacter faecitabidus]TQL58508.1 mycothiol synthase [Rarobacter faecitabidus]